MTRPAGYCTNRGRQCETGAGGSGPSSRSSLFSKVSFHKNYSQGFWIWRGDQSEHVGAMLLDLCKVLFSIVSRTIANHRADNLQPTMSQAAQSARVALSFISVGVIKGRCPSARMSAQVCPQVKSGPQPVDASPPYLHTFDLPALVSNRSCARAGLDQAEQAP